MYNVLFYNDDILDRYLNFFLFLSNYFVFQILINLGWFAITKTVLFLKCQTCKRLINY